MPSLGSHPHIVTVFDLGEHVGQPYMVTELMGGGDVEGAIEDAIDHRLPLERAQAQPVRAPVYPDGLTQREVEVLRLVAAGRTGSLTADTMGE